MAKPLFVAGCARSGTTALARYLNEHETVLVCIERYKYRPRRITPDLFTFERILDYSSEETNVPEAWHSDLLANKDPARLRWVGDKLPNYYKRFFQLYDDNPGARFIVIHRALEDVAASFEQRRKNPDDSWPHGIKEAVRQWNLVLRRTREFVEGEAGTNLLILEYSEFFERPDSCARLLSRFLEIEIGESIIEAWSTRSVRYRTKRDQRPRQSLTDEERAFVRAGKDRRAEQWLLERVRKQRNELLGGAP